jgi:hypothetical protein
MPFAVLLIVQAKHRRIRRWDVLWAVYNSAVRFFDMYRRRQQRMDSYLKVGTEISRFGFMNQGCPHLGFGSG